MNRSTRYLVLALLLAAPALAGATEYTLTLSPESTDVSFSLKATGEDVSGHLHLRSGEIRFDPDAGTATGRIEIDALRTETGNEKRDKKMHKTVLESEAHPLIVFEPQAFEGSLDQENGEVKLVGTVTLLGVEHPLELSATVETDGGRLSFESSFIVPFVSWGLHDPSWFVFKVAKEVDVTIAATGVVSPAGTDSTAGAD